MYEYPPILQGTEKKQIADMRDYLVRLIRTMEEEKTEAEKMQMLRDSKSTAAVKAQPQSASAAAKPGLKLKDVLEAIFSPGSLFINAYDINPKELFGFGEWVQIKDTFLLAAGDSYAAGSTGGEATHTLTEAEMPNISGSITMHSSEDNARGSNFWSPTGVFKNSPQHTCYVAPSSGSSGANSISGISFSAGGSQPHNNMPPYLAVYVWQRIS